MARIYQTDINLSGFQLLNARVQNLASAPSSPTKGIIYFDTTLNQFGFWNGTTWIYPGTVSDATTVAKGIVQLAGDLAGTAASPQIATGVIVDADINASAAIAFAKLASPVASFGFNSQRITALGTPTAATDAAPVNFARRSHNAVVASAANINVASAPATIDGITVLTGEDVLLLAQSTGTETGLWTYQGSGNAMTRAISWNSRNFERGESVTVAQGTYFRQEFIQTGARGTIGTNQPVFSVGYAPPPSNSLVITDFASSLTLDSIATSRPAVATITANSQKIANLSPGTLGTDAVNLNQLNGVSQGIRWKDPVQYASSAAATYTIVGGAVTSIAGTTFGGGSPAVGERLLVFDAPAATGAGGAGVPSTQPANGIYVVTNNTTNLTVSRATDADIAAEIQGATVSVDLGTLAGRYYNQTADAITLNTTALNWVRFQSASDLVGDGATVVRAGDTLSTKNPGSAATTGGPAAPGSGLVTAGTMGVARALQFQLQGDGSRTSFNIPHGLGTSFCHVVVYSGAAQVECDISLSSSTVAVVTFGTAPATSVYYDVIVIG